MWMVRSRRMAHRYDDWPLAFSPFFCGGVVLHDLVREESHASRRLLLLLQHATIPSQKLTERAIFGDEPIRKA